MGRIKFHQKSSYELTAEQFPNFEWGARYLQESE